ncbi:MAG: YraN family protein [Microthrixaceae bacterium]
MPTPDRPAITPPPITSPPVTSPPVTSVDRSRQALGAWGEAKVARWYLAAGYEVLDRNWRCARGEIDLVVGRNGGVVIVEVKTRSSDRFGAPAQAVGRAKQARLRRLAAAWLAEHGGGVGSVRFDVASVLAGKVTVIEGAF